MNQSIKKTGTPRSFVYINNNPLLYFQTNQQAWDYLCGLLETALAEDISWPENVYLAFVIESTNSIFIPQVAKVVKEDSILRNEFLWGDKYDVFCRKVMDDWAQIRSSMVHNGE